jgi:hypothetical protein
VEDRGAAAGWTPDTGWQQPDLSSPEMLREQLDAHFRHLMAALKGEQ